MAVCGAIDDARRRPARCRLPPDVGESHAQMPPAACSEPQLAYTLCNGGICFANGGLAHSRQQAMLDAGLVCRSAAAVPCVRAIKAAGRAKSTRRRARTQAGCIWLGYRHIAGSRSRSGSWEQSGRGRREGGSRSRGARCSRWSRAAGEGRGGEGPGRWASVGVGAARGWPPPCGPGRRPAAPSRPAHLQAALVLAATGWVVAQSRAGQHRQRRAAVDADASKWVSGAGRRRGGRRHVGRRRSCTRGGGSARLLGQGTRRRAGGAGRQQQQQRQGWDGVPRHRERALDQAVGGKRIWWSLAPAAAAAGAGVSAGMPRLLHPACTGAPKCGNAWARPGGRAVGELTEGGRLHLDQESCRPRPGLAGCCARA